MTLEYSCSSIDIMFEETHLADRSEGCLEISLRMSD